jgi:hypothetical protein
MSVRIENFVDVQITRRAVQESGGAYDTAVYVVPSTASQGNAFYFINGKNGTGDGTKNNPKTIDAVSGDNNLKYFGIEFFANGGKKLHVVNSLSFSSTDNCWNFTDKKNSTATHLPVEEILIFDTSATQTNASTNANAVSGIEKKIFVNTTNSTSLSSYLPYTIAVYKNVEVSTNVAGEKPNVSAAPFLAYYTKIIKNSSVDTSDLAFTKTSFADVVENSTTNEVVITEPTDANAKAMITNNINFIATIAGVPMIIGGSDETGENDITNLFMQIVLQQTLTNALMKLLSSKIKLNTAGITSVKNAVGVELDKYVNYDYISTDKLWTEDDLYLDGELIAAKGSPLARGYVVHVSPITQENIKNHQIPTIYVLYGDSVGVRKIVVQGEVF